MSRSIRSLSRPTPSDPVRRAGRRASAALLMAGVVVTTLFVPPLSASAAPTDADSTGIDSAGVDSAGVDGAGVDSTGVDGADLAGADPDGATVDGADTDRYRGRSFAVLADGLTGNKALGLSSDGSLLLGGAKADGTGVLQKVVRSGRSAGTVTTLADLPAQPTDVGSAGRKAVWVLFGASSSPEEGQPPSAVAPANRLYRWTERGGLAEVADLGAFAAANPDPADLEGNPGESNAYGLQALSDGSVLVADAAANALRRVWADGRIVTVARFPVQVISTSHIPDPTLPPELPAEAVPTTVTVGRDGAWYVGELKGFPFTPGTSKVWRIARGSQDVTCDAAAPSRACSVSQDGLTSIIDMTVDRRGRLDVLELVKGGLAAAEGADPAAPPPPGTLVQIDRRGNRIELAAGKIVLPGGIVADPSGRGVYVTDGQLVPGGGRLLRIGC
ncbi:ScyD/ScyE family protein [Nakamurella flavida]|uniref:ScyD/ScyE family protein n=1 Tax=Nakamurella flavida TaxID=363630 RepID=A0A939C532_9ACTN|nr:ScyD/ScyE family protein [Nakamurella flavida]MBM9475802.1 ScyD/ScyE family protein [Nakamurella flavida]